uniref:Uncharacterized protein n=1 Tax=Molossus molossus TaxID=27622 RepID=A0A7J8CZ22_MOLMO|nr:hypothetical protein HJG59_009422 [Molossus molossus]
MGRGRRAARAPSPTRHLPGTPSPDSLHSSSVDSRHPRDTETARQLADPDGQQGRRRAPSHRPSLRFPGVQRKDTVQEACPLPQPESSLGLTSFRLQAGFPVCPGSSPSLKVFRAAGRPGSRGKTLQIVSRTPGHAVAGVGPPLMGAEEVSCLFLLGVKPQRACLIPE